MTTTNIPIEKLGAGIPAPEKTEPHWTTLKEAEEYERMMLRRFVKKDDPRGAKKFFYKIVDAFKCAPVDSISPANKYMTLFLVRKFYRDKMIDVTVRDNDNPENVSKDKANAPVQGHQWDDKSGAFICVDEDAERTISADKFLKEFEVDKD